MVMMIKELMWSSVGTGTGGVKYWGTMTQLIISCQQSLTSLLLVMTVAGDSSRQSHCDIETKATSANITTMGKFDPWISSEEYNVVIGWVSGYLTLGWLGLFGCLWYIWHLFRKETKLREELKKVKSSQVHQKISYVMYVGLSHPLKMV